MTLLKTNLFVSHGGELIGYSSIIDSNDDQQNRSTEKLLKHKLITFYNIHIYTMCILIIQVL